MYADTSGSELFARYDEKKLFEHQLKDAVDYFLSNLTNNIKVVNLSLGNSDEIWDGNRTHQFPLAALLDELAITYPNVVFVVSAGNSNPSLIFNTLAEIIDGYPDYLFEEPGFKIINPSTSALSLTVGSLATPHRTFVRQDDEIWSPIGSKKTILPLLQEQALALIK